MYLTCTKKLKKLSILVFRFDICWAAILTLTSLKLLAISKSKKFIFQRFMNKKCGNVYVGILFHCCMTKINLLKACEFASLRFTYSAFDEWLTENLQHWGIGYYQFTGKFYSLQKFCVSYTERNNFPVSRFMILLTFQFFIYLPRIKKNLVFIYISVKSIINMYIKNSK